MEEIRKEKEAEERKKKDEENQRRFEETARKQREREAEIEEKMRRAEGGPSRGQEQSRGGFILGIFFLYPYYKFLFSYEMP